MTTSICAAARWPASSARQVQEGHALEAEALRQRARLLHQLGPGLDAVNGRPRRLEEQVVQDEAQVRLARPVVGQCRWRPASGSSSNSFSMNCTVADLFELAPRVLVDAALAREDVQFLQQFDATGRAHVRTSSGGIGEFLVALPRAIAAFTSAHAERVPARRGRGAQRVHVGLVDRLGMREGSDRAVDGSPRAAGAASDTARDWWSW